MNQILVNITTDNSSIKEAAALMEWAINQQELRDYILNFTNEYKEKNFLQSNQDNAWHLEKFVGGPCKFSIAYFDSTTEIIGYTDGVNKVVNLNDKYLNRDLPAICNTLIHEYCHMVGMTHSFFNPGNIIWAQTAPYAIGAYVQYMIEKKFGLVVSKPFFPKASAFRRFIYRLKKLFKQ